MILWLIAHVGCWPSGPAAPALPAITSAPVPAATLISTHQALSHGRLASCPRKMLRRAGCQNIGGGRAQAAGGTHHHICPCACRVQQC